MSRLGYAIGEIASEISKNYGAFIGLQFGTNYTNSGDVLTELRNIRKMLTRPSVGNMLAAEAKLPGLDNGGVIEELEALAMLFKSGAVEINVQQKDIFPIDINDFTIRRFSKTATLDKDNTPLINIKNSESFGLPLNNEPMLLKVTHPDGDIENHILLYETPLEGTPEFLSTTDTLVYLQLEKTGGLGMLVPSYFDLGVGSGARPEGEYTVEVYYRPLSGGGISEDPVQN